MTGTVTYDQSDRTCVAVCSCGWRTLTVATTSARLEVRLHQLRAHVGDKQMNDTVNRALRRGEQR